MRGDDVRKKAATTPAEAHTKFVPPQDEHAGKGGSYVLDPATGKRTLQERTQDRDDTAAAVEKE